MADKIGFFGAGNMGRAIMQGLIKNGLYAAENICVFDILPAALENIRKDLGVSTFGNEADLAAQADIVIMAVKPQYADALMESIKSKLKKDVIFVSIAAGVSIGRIASILGDNTKIVRTMPNTPALVGAGITALTFNSLVAGSDQEKVKSIFVALGATEVIPENMMDPVVGVASSSPAYTFMFIEAMADGAVLEGLPRDKAMKFAAHAVLGAAKLLLESGRHPGELKDMVSSPGGTTIEGVRCLEENGFRYAAMQAVIASSQKNKRL